MSKAGEDHEGEICNKCGDQGVQAALLKCTMCKLVWEHRYCTVTFPTVLEPWICETCGDKKETLQMPYRSSSFNRAKESAKVKFISAEEVASLAVGCQTPVSSTRRRLCTSVTRTNSILKKPSFRSKGTSKQLTARAELEGYSEEKTSGISIPPGFQPLAVDNETPRRSSLAMNSEDVLASPQSGNGESQLTRSDSRCDLRLSSPNMMNEQLMPPDKTLATQHDRSDFQGSGLLLTFSNGGEIQWRGRLMIKDTGGIHKYEDIQAHFPCKISSKAYDASKSLPEELQFRFINRPDNWPKIFQQDPPSCDDVAMYFLPSEFCRRKEKYIRLLERMDNHDLAMCCLLDGFELLIYTSKLLSLDPQKLNTEVYLWGMFRQRRTKKQKQETRLSGGCKYTEAKLQIDKVGGTDVRKSNKPVVKHPAMQKDQLDNHRSALLKLQKSHEEQNFPSVPPGFFELTKINLKHGSGPSEGTGKSLIPPVFEKENAASCGAKGKHIISCSSAEKAPPIANNSKFRKLTDWGEAPTRGYPAESISQFSPGYGSTRGYPAESISQFSPGYGSVELPSRTSSVLSLFPESMVSESNAAKHRNEGENLVHVINPPDQMVSPDLSLSRPQYINDRKRWIPAPSRDRLKKDECGKDVRLSL